MKKTYYLFQIAILLFCLDVYSQTATKTIELVDKNLLLESHSLKDNGFILKTGTNLLNSKKQDWKLSYYNNDLSLVWETPLECFENVTGYNYYTFLTPVSNSIFYYISNEYVTQITKEGKVNKYKIDSLYNFGLIKANFVTDQYLSYLAEDKVKDPTTKKKVKKYYLYRFDNKTFQMSKFDLNLPDLNINSNNTMWNYFGHNESNFYVFSKKVPFGKDSFPLSYSIYVFDFEGKLLTNFEITLPNTFVNPSIKLSETNDSKRFRFIEFYASDPIKFNLEAFSDIIIDSSNIYVYGFYSNKLGSENYTEENKGLFINKYSLRGELIWKLKKPFLSTANINPLLVTKVTFNANIIAFQFGLMKNLGIETHLINNTDGQLIESFSTVFSKKDESWKSIYSDAVRIINNRKVNPDPFVFCFPESKKPKIMNYLETTDNIYTEVFINKSKDILIKYLEKENKIELKSFEK